MKLLHLLFVLMICTVSAQKVLSFDTLKLKEAKDMLVDDYGNLYIYKNKDFTFTKYDSLGKQLGQMMFTVPFKVQSIQNPLNIILFSENAQEMKFVDQNLNEIQKIDFRHKFSFIKHAYAEDLQQIWLVDDSTKRLLQYNFRNDTTINAYAFDQSFEDITDLLVYENKVYILTKNQLRVFNLKFEKLFEATVEDGKRFRRENEMILIITKNSILKYNPERDLTKIFEHRDAQIVDKNSLAYFEIKENKLYLYSLANSRTLNRQPKEQPETKIEEKSAAEQEDTSSQQIEKQRRPGN